MWEGADHAGDACQRPAAYFLYRFGILLAANALAHNEFPAIPLANVYEQGIAQSIVAKLQ